MSVRVLYEFPAAGSLDLASARRALFGWLWARHEGGQFLLSSEGSAASPVVATLLKELRLLGLDWDQESDASSGALPPQSVHLPPLEGPEAGVAVCEWVRRGYSGLALANCLARLGWTPRGKRALLTLDELAARFEWGRVSRRPVVFQREQLDWFNRRWLCTLDADEVAALLIPHWRAAYGHLDRAEGTALSPEMWRRALALAIREELDLPVQAVDKARFAFVDRVELDAASRMALGQPYADPILRVFAHELPAVTPFSFDSLDAFCRALRLRFKGTLGIRSRDVMYVLRAALTGEQGGPCLVVVCQLLGPARCIQRAEKALGAVSG